MKVGISFERARITAIGHRNPNGEIRSQIKVVALASDKTLKLIRARWPLEYAMENVQAVHEIAKVSRLAVDSQLVSKFKVFYQPGEDGPMVSFMVQHCGSPFDLFEHWLRVGEGEGTCTLAPRQVEMFPETGKKGSKKG